MRQGLLLFILCLFLPLHAMAESLSFIKSLQIQPNINQTRFTFELTKKTSGRVRYFPQQQNLVIEFVNASKNFNIKDASLPGANVSVIRTEVTANHTVRFILTVKEKVRWTTTFLPTQNDSVLFQFDVINVIPHVPKSTSLKTTTLTPSIKPEAITDLLAKLKSIPVIPSHQVTIVIDAGHGGKDTGAIGPHGVQEKQVVLKIARQLATAIRQQAKVRVILTRDGDYYLPLRERLSIARKNAADIFIAVHADAYFDSNAQGASVYALSERGATNEAARWLAQRDRYADLADIALDQLQDRSLMLRSVLIDLSQTATINDSVLLGNRVLRALKSMASIHYRKVEQAPFVVLKSPDIPSILIETGFITNVNEEQRLADPRYQKALAEAIWHGISQYVEERRRDLMQPSRLAMIISYIRGIDRFYDTAHPEINTTFG